MLGTNVWRHALGVDRATVIESVEVDEEASSAVIHVRPKRPTKRRCGRCGRCGVRSPGYDQGTGRRNWRAMDLTPRVNCPTHDPTVAQVPWARHGAGHTQPRSTVGAAS